MYHDIKCRRHCKQAIETEGSAGSVGAETAVMSESKVRGVSVLVGVREEDSCGEP